MGGLLMPGAKTPTPTKAKGAPPPPAPRGAGRSARLYYFFLVSAILAALAAAAALLIQFFETRPLNLRHHSARLATIAEQTLVEHFVPAESIRRHPSEVRRDDGAVWDFYLFDAEAPRHAAVDGVVQVLREAMLRHYVNTADAPEEGGARRISLSLGEREFARFILRPAPPPRIMRRDLRASCERLAREIEQLFPDALQRDGALDREDDAARWTFTRLRVRGAAELRPGDLLERIGAVIGTLDIAATTREDAAGAVVVDIACSGKPAVEIRFAAPASAETPPPPPESAPTTAPPEAHKEETGLSASEEMPQEVPEADAVALEEPETAAPIPAKVARVAIVLDDGGYGGEVTDRVLDLDTRLTLAILPNTPFAKSTAARATEKGFEVMLHMPMETDGNAVKPFPGEISPAMDRKEIQRLTRDAIDQVPGARGVNNHRGSRFTEDAARLNDFFDVLKEERLYFLDSRTHAASRAYDVAREKGVPAAARDVFLDNHADTEYIRNQLAKLVEKAKRQGSAIGIGHFRNATAEVLAEELPRLLEAGVELVPASELVQ